MLEPDNYKQGFHRHKHLVGHLKVMLTVLCGIDCPDHGRTSDTPIQRHPPHHCNKL